MEIKKCTGCGKEKPWTSEYFKKDKSMKSGLASKCKECDKIKRQNEREKYLKEHEEEIKEKEQQRRIKEEILKKIKVCSKCGVEYSATSKYFMKDAKGKNGLSSQCKKCKAKLDKEYQSENHEELLMKKKSYYVRTKPIRLEQTKKYARNNKDRKKVIRQRYEAKIKKLENTLTYEQWENIKNEFENKCAYCGGEKKLEMEHIIPRSKGGGHKKSNIVPACHKCNHSKRAKRFEEWYHKQTFYSCERELKILQHIKESKEGERKC